MPTKPKPAANTRSHTFKSANFAVVRAENIDDAANLKADLVAVFQPVNFQEMFAVERIALAQQSLLRCYRMESGLHTLGLDQVLEKPGVPLILKKSEFTHAIEVATGQNHSYWIAAGFFDLNNKPLNWQLFLRYQAQTERLYRHAIEEFERLYALRDVLPHQPFVDPKPEPEIPHPPQAEPIDIDPPDIPPVPQPAVANRRPVQVQKRPHPSTTRPCGTLVEPVPDDH